MSKLQKALFLSDKGYADLKKAIFACTLTNLAMLLPFCVTVMIFSEILTPFVSGGEIQWNHIWLLWGAGIISAILVFLAAKNDYRKTYIASYKESNTTRLRVAELSPLLSKMQAGNPDCCKGFKNNRRRKARRTDAEPMNP